MAEMSRGEGIHFSGQPVLIPLPDVQHDFLKRSEQRGEVYKERYM